MTAPACIGTPISWLRLETFAAGKSDAQVREHVAACPACKLCLDEIRADLVALPPLVVPAAPERRAWWKLLVPAFAAVAAAVIGVVLWRGGPEPAPSRDHVVAIKGIGEVILGTVRERGGDIRLDVRTFAPGDRWKLVVTCAPEAAGTPLAVEVTVAELGTAQIDKPLPPASIACGNRVVLPGAFSLRGGQHRVCARIAGETACVLLSPQR